jgi:hypothetical protein
MDRGCQESISAHLGIVRSKESPKLPHQLKADVKIRNSREKKGSVEV